MEGEAKSQARHAGGGGGRESECSSPPLTRRTKKCTSIDLGHLCAAAIARHARDAIATVPYHGFALWRRLAEASASKWTRALRFAAKCGRKQTSSRLGTWLSRQGFARINLDADLRSRRPCCSVLCIPHRLGQYTMSPPATPQAPVTRAACRRHMPATATTVNKYT